MRKSLSVGITVLWSNPQPTVSFFLHKWKVFYCFYFRIFLVILRWICFDLTNSLSGPFSNKMAAPSTPPLPPCSATASSRCRVWVWGAVFLWPFTSKKTRPPTLWMQERQLRWKRRQRCTEIIRIYLGMVGEPPDFGVEQRKWDKRDSCYQKAFKQWHFCNFSIITKEFKKFVTHECGKNLVCKLCNTFIKYFS